MVPTLVAEYLERALPSGAPAGDRVRLGQRGELWPHRYGHPRAFTATEELSTHDVAFVWRARFPLGVSVVDAFDGESGFLDGRLLGRLPLLHDEGPELSRGEALRYLAELPWVPEAMAANDRLHWREVDARAVEVSAVVEGGVAAVVLGFDAEGDVESAFTDDRPYRAGRRFLRRRWLGRFDDYGWVDGARIPLRGEAAWLLPDGVFTYWRCRVTSFDRCLP